eukprot:10161249-Heterocapsa_arctica.AAC.1
MKGQKKDCVPDHVHGYHHYGKSQEQMDESTIDIKKLSHGVHHNNLFENIDCEHKREEELENML